jgi:cytochrome c oxidase subunit II
LQSAFPWLPPLMMLGGCRGALSALDPAGPASESIATLWWAMLAGAALIFVLVMVLLTIGLLRRRPVVRTSERTWLVGGGLVFPVLVLAGLLGYGLVVGERLLARPGVDVVSVRAHASQWQWTFSQRGARAPIERVGRLDIPAGRPVDVLITTDDVIHSFWVPRLGGKRDAIPGKVNTLRLQARRPGTYAGQCAEYCGVGHLAMRFTVIAHDDASWAAFLDGGVEGRVEGGAR